MITNIIIFLALMLAFALIFIGLCLLPKGDEPDRPA
jgi:hypothetical protein